MSDPAGATGSDLDEGPPLDSDGAGFDDELERRRARADIEVPIVAALRQGQRNPVEPTRYTGSDTLRFACHPGVSCWNQCCHDTQITLTPRDVARLGKRLGQRPGEFAAQYGRAVVHEPSDMPVLQLEMRAAGAAAQRPCVFLDPVAGCTVYADRPDACRYYPLGLATVKMKGHDEPEDFYFLVREPHCRGHEEPREQTVDEFLAAQGIDGDERNRGWTHILMKLASWKSVGGPGGKAPDERVRRMFLMVSTDPDAFRRFVLGSSFLDKYAVAPQVRAEVERDDELLTMLGFDWLRAVLFNEPTLHLREPVLQEAIARARRDTGAT
jgi:hypothetical protein